MTNVTVSLKKLESTCLEILASRGASLSTARWVFEDYLEAEATGRASHGFISFDVAAGAFPTRGTAEIVEHRGSVISINGNGDCGHTAARLGIDVALEHLHERSLYCIGIRDITRFNTPGPIARYAAKQGAIALVMEYGGANFMAPFGGVEAALSTNPLAIAIPDTDPLFVLDIATSERAFGYVTIAKLENSSIPDSWALDSEGKATTDPTEAKALRPFGGYKGYGLALALEILAGALVGVPIGTTGSLSSRGALIMLLTPDIFGVSRDAFVQSVRAFLAEVLESKPAIPEVPVRYPGEEGSRNLRKVLDRGELVLSTHAWEKVLSLTEKEDALHESANAR